MSEPIVWINKDEIRYLLATKQNGGKDWKSNLGLIPEEGDVPLYLKKEWVGLTDDEIDISIYATSSLVKGQAVVEFARAIEAKLKEKNET
jgi:hypothetical protein